MRTAIVDLIKKESKAKSQRRVEAIEEYVGITKYKAEQTS